MEPREREQYDGALAADAYYGGDDSKSFKALSAGEQAKWIAVAKALRAGVSGADGSTDPNAGPNQSSAHPSVDPITGAPLVNGRQVATANDGVSDSGDELVEPRLAQSTVTDSKTKSIADKPLKK